MRRPYLIYRAEKAIRSVKQSEIDSYSKYWDSITPKTHQEYWLRWVFAFMSIHTTWKQNVQGFQAVSELKDLDFNRNQLKRAVEASRVGLTSIRVEGLWKLSNSFRDDPLSWYPKEGESMSDCRGRLLQQTFGIGITKVSFVLEMLSPRNCDAVCLDTHLLQLYRLKKKETPSKQLYKEIESHWNKVCREVGFPSPLVRHIFWDRKQGKTLNRYWAYVFEK